MIDPDIQRNSQEFRQTLPEKLAANLQSVFAFNAAKIDEAYARLTTFEAWRTYVLDACLPSTATGFFAEAQNDGLTSIVLMSAGLWRPAMKSLRSLIENMLQCCYFMDHAVEYHQWESGKRIHTFQKLFEYFESHPDLTALPQSIGPAAALKGYYSQLSNVVHSSSKAFRMTDDLNKSKLWKLEAQSIGEWSTLQKHVCREVNLLLIALFKGHLEGAKAKGLRESLSYVVPAGKDAAVRKSFGVRVIRG